MTDTASDSLPAEALADALPQLLEELTAIPEAELVPVTLDVAAAVVTAIGVARKLREHRPALVARFGEHGVRDVDRLELVARAAGEANAKWTPAKVDLRPLSAAVQKARRILVADVDALVARELLPDDARDHCRGRTGFTDIAFDVVRLVSLLRTNWALVDPFIGATTEDLDRYESLAGQLAIAAGEREQPVPSASQVLRQRAFTLLVRTYDSVRQMVVFLRWAQRDGEQFAPSLYRKPSRRRAVTEAEPVDAHPSGAAAAGVETSG